MATARIRRAIRSARQYHDAVILNVPAELADELLAANLISPRWLMDAAGRTAWQLTGDGLRLRELLLDSPARRVRHARAARVAALWLADVTGQQQRGA